MAQRLATLASVFHGSESLVVAWQRSGARSHVDVYVGGAGLAGRRRDPGAPAVLSLPPGSRGLPQAAGAVADTLAATPYWCRIAVLADALLAGEPTTSQPADSAAQPSLEDSFLTVWRDPFAWLVFAEPVPRDRLPALATEIADAQRQAQARAGSSPEFAVRAARLEHRHRELSQASATGLWRVHLLGGGADAAAARRVAALLCASVDLDGLPYALVPDVAAVDLKSVLASPAAEPGIADQPVSSAMLARLARPPATEIPGVRSRLRSEFDVNVESTAESRRDAVSSIQLGHILDRNEEPTGPLTLSRGSLNRHTFVGGATGAGKSQTVRALLQAVTEHDLPWLVVEPAKAEYRLMAARVGAHRLRVIRPGDPDAPPAGLNPLEPAIAADGSRFPLQTHIDLVRSLFVAAFEATEPFPQVLAAALNRCYEDLGWDLVLGEPVTPGVRPRYPTLDDLQRTAERVVQEIGYGKEITDNVRGFIAVRLSSLRLGTTGRFFEGGHRIDVDQLLRHNVVLEIEDVGDDRDKAFLMGTVLIQLVEHLRLRHRDGGPTTTLRHVSVFEEAHRLLRRSDEPGPAAHAVEMFAGLLAEIRAYGEGLVIAEQIPSKLTEDVIKNTAVKIVHRLPARDDREAVGATMNLTDDQSTYVVTLPPGRAAVFADGFDYPVLVAMPDGTGVENAHDRAPPAGLTDLISRRSDTCGLDCAADPCTLRQMRAAQHALRADPRIVVWAELAVLAHLTGWTTPVPTDALLADLRLIDGRTRDCALSHAVDAAVAARCPALASRVAPTGLAVHVTDVLRDHIATGRRHIGEEPQWLAPAYRWCYVWDALTTASQDRTGSGAGRHPRTAEWERDYRTSIPGGTVSEQLAAVTRWFDADQRDATARQTIAFGATTAPAIAAAVGVSPSHPDWSARLTEHLDQFVSCRWPLRYLTGTAAS